VVRIRFSLICVLLDVNPEHFYAPDKQVARVAPP
jgi:hypothetical protein